MSLLHRELVELIDEAATRLEPTEYGPWLGQQTVTVAGDPTVPNAPTLTASPADQAIDLVITPPSTNTNGSQYLDHKEFEVFYSTSPGIDVNDPSTYVDSFTLSATKHTFPATTTYYFRAVARDKYGNISAPSSEVSATPISSGYESSVDDYTSNIANVYVGTGIIGIEFQPPKSTWVRWAGWKLYYDVDDGTGWTDTWTLIYTGSGPGFLHKGLNESYAYKYKLTVLGEDGTETTGTVSDNDGAGYTPNASDNSAILDSTIFAERMIATKEMISRTFIGGVLQSTNWSATAGTQIDLDNGTFKLGGSDSPKLSWDGTTLKVSGAIQAGSNLGGDNVVIVDSSGLDVGSAGRIAGGATGYDSGTGFWLGYDSSDDTYKFFVGDSGGTKLTWNGHTLTVKGTLYATDGYFGSSLYKGVGITSNGLHIFSGDGSCIRAGASGFKIGTGVWIGSEGGVYKFYMGDVSKEQYMAWDGDQITCVGYFQSHSSSHKIRIEPGETVDWLWFYDDDGNAQAMIDTSGTAYFIEGLGVGAGSFSNILTVTQGSATDPIADAWTTYSTADTKEIVSQVNPHGYLKKLLKIDIYRWKRKPKQKRTRKHDTERISPVIGLSSHLPEEILSFDKDGKPQGIDLLGYIGFVHAAVRELAERLDIKD